MPNRAKHGGWKRGWVAVMVLVGICLGMALPAGAATRLDTPTNVWFTSGGVDFAGLEFLLHIPAKGNVWIAIPRNHDLEAGPVTPVIVLNPDTTLAN